MSQATVNKILSQLETLEINELQQLQQSIQFRLLQQETSQQSAFHQILLASGLVQQVKDPSSKQPTDWQLIQIQGKGLSETILEERR
jgi:hypothetical protein